MDPLAKGPVDDPIGQTQSGPPPVTEDNLAATRTLEAMANERPPSPPRGQRGRYVILKEHASGGLGTVSVALDSRLKRHVALKEIRPDRSGRREFRQRFVNEAEITSLLEHPGIVPVYTFDEDEEGRPYYAMRFVQGRTLSEAIREFHEGGRSDNRETTTGPQGDRETRRRSDFATERRSDGSSERDSESAKSSTREGRASTVAPSPRHPFAPSFSSLTFRNLLQRFIAVCNTVAFAHSRGVIHRDLKPSNVMIGDYGETLVLDWGVAKRLDKETRGQGDQEKENEAEISSPCPLVPFSPCHEAAGGVDEDEQLTQQGQVLGTAAYMSPEQARGTEVGTPTDIYALGGILYELLTGRRPYRGRSSAEVLDQLNAGPPPSPVQVHRDVPRPLEAICLKALARQPADRYSSATDLAREVERWLADEPLLAYDGTWLEQTGRWTRKHRSLLIAAIVVTAVVALGLLAGLLIVAALNRELERSNSDLSEALAREEAERQRANDSESVTRQAHAQAERQKKEAEEALADTQAFSKFLVDDLLAAARPAGERGGLGIRVTVLHALDEAAKNIPARFAGRPRAEALARHDLGVTYRLIGQLDKAEQQLREAFQLRLSALGADEEDTLRTQNSLAAVLTARSKYAEALAIYQDNYPRRKAKLGAEHRDTLMSLNNLASSYQALGNMKEALTLYKEVLEQRRAILGADHADTLASMNNLARAYEALGDFAAAVPLLEETVQLREDQLGGDHPHTLASKDNLAVAYRSAGRLADAERLFESTLRLRREKLGPDHPDTLKSMSGLATVKQALGRQAEALALLEETLKLRTATLGPTHTDTATSMNNLANAYRDADRVREALVLYERVLKLYGNNLGAEHPYTLMAMHNLGHAYQAAGRVREGLPLLEEALHLRKAKLGPDHPGTLSTMSQLSVAYHAAGRSGEALALGEEALHLRKAKLGPDHPDTLTTMGNLAGVHVARAEYAQAERLLLECQAGVERNIANMPRHLKEDTVPRLIRLYERWNKPAEAERWRQKLPPAGRLRDALERDAAWPLLWGWPRF
jgi:serine/threonine protein kinase